MPGNSLIRYLTRCARDVVVWAVDGGEADSLDLRSSRSTGQCLVSAIDPCLYDTVACYKRFDLRSTETNDVDSCVYPVTCLPNFGICPGLRQKTLEHLVVYLSPHLQLKSEVVYFSTRQLLVKKASDEESNNDAKQLPRR